MSETSKSVWGPLLAALVFFTATCAPPDMPQPHAPRSLASAAAALRTGDIVRFRADQAKGEGLANHATTLATRLDPDAWLIALGAASREYDLAQAARSMTEVDDRALAQAIGFGDQQLVADMLSGGGSIYSRRADGRNYYESGPQPIDLLDGVLVPSLPEGSQALEITLWGKLGERMFKVTIGLDAGGVTSLAASLELAPEAIPAPDGAARYADPALSLPSTDLLHALDVAALADERWVAAGFVLLRPDATIEKLRLHRNADGWATADCTTESQPDRLGALRDGRLEFLSQRAASFQRSSGRWPRGLHEITIKPWQLVDPAAPSGRLGWADHDARPTAGLELAPSENEEYAAICSHETPNGQRAITHDGRFIWVR